MSKCDYKISSIEPIGFYRAMVTYEVFEGDITTETERAVNDDGTSSNQNVTRYRRTSKIAGAFKINLPEDDAAMRRELNTILQTYVTNSRTAIAEQVNA
jgi:hypothetical protein